MLPTSLMPKRLAHRMLDELDAVAGRLLQPDRDVVHRLASLDPWLAFDCAGASHRGHRGVVDAYRVVAGARSNEERLRALLAAIIAENREGAGARVADRRVRVLNSAEDVLRDEDATVSIWASEPAMGTMLRDLVGALRGPLGTFVERFPDVGGANALVNGGRVKDVAFPVGCRTVWKGVNPSKEGRFANEVVAAALIAARLGNGSPVRLPTSNESWVSVVSATALVRDGRTGELFAVMPYVRGRSMDTLLAEDRSVDRRRRLLQDSRAILDVLFELGVLWHDMSPRNILVEQRGDAWTYLLLDFEKSTVSAPEPVDPEVREWFARGQIGIEEYGVLCTEEEVGDLLRADDDRSAWSIDETQPPRYPVRPDLEALLASRGWADASAGACNALDLAIINVRRPRLRGDGTWWYPGQIGFRQQHYLACLGDEHADEYDTRLTELFLLSNITGEFESVATGAEARSFHLEEACVLDVLRTRAGSQSGEAAVVATEVKQGIDRALTVMAAESGRHHRVAEPSDV